MRGPHNVDLEYVFVLQNNPSICILKSVFVLQIEGVILQNEDIFLMNIVRSVSAIIVSWWLFEETQRLHIYHLGNAFVAF